MKRQVIDDPGRPNWRRDGPRFALVTWLIATIAMVATSIGTALVVSLVAVGRAALDGEQSGERLGEIAQEALDSSSMYWTLVISSQIVLLTVALLACRVLRKPMGERLGLVATSLNPVQQAVLLAATVVPFSLGVGAAWLVSSVIRSSNAESLGLQRMWYEGSRIESASWILLIALLPGFVEEVFYRGFLLRGFVLRWRPGTSILATSVLFAVVHGDVAWALAIFPLGLWLGWVAWRTGSVMMTFLMHASVNGVWTTGMMYVHRDPASEPILNWIAIAILGVGLAAFPWSLAILRRSIVVKPGAAERGRFRLATRVVVFAAAAGAIVYVLVPPGTAPPAPAQASSRPTPKISEIKANAATTATCTAMGEAGACEFALMPGVGTRVTLPRNRAGIDELFIMLDAASETVWLAYAGELSGKGSERRPLGIVEQFASAEPTVVCITLAPGPPPVNVRLTLGDDSATKTEYFERAKAEEGWSFRGRK
jgi:membrane protease YdiL (CAAX protease family)